MGWRYRKRIKILPGINLNISKSGIGLNIGIKGANVTIGPKGTYVNTGIPGTGLYRRDKIAESDSNENISVICSNSSSGISISNNLYPFNSKFFFYYLFPLFVLLIVALLVNSNILHFLGAYLIIGLSHVICILNIDYSGFFNAIGFSRKPSYQVKQRREIIQKAPFKEKYLHLFGSSISLINAICTPLLLLLNESLFSKWFMHHSMGGEISIIIVLLLIYGWMDMCIFEAKQFLYFNDYQRDVSQSIPSIVQREKPECDGGIIPNEDCFSDESSVIYKDKTDITPNIFNEETIEEINKKSDLINDKFDRLYDSKLDIDNYHYPSLDLLYSYDYEDKPNTDVGDINEKKNRLVELLSSFGIEINCIKMTVSPRFTFFEIGLATEISVRKIYGIEEDIALRFYSSKVKIVPIPGKGTIGIEIPNIKFNLVSIKSILDTRKYQETTMELPCAIGKTITNEVFMFDLTKAPHILIAGSTGQGKSVTLNTMIMSLLYKKHPAEMKLVLMDPYGVEFGVYSQIANHFLATLPNESTIVSNSNKAVSTLNGLCKEMEVRYDLLKKAYVRNIKEYNRKFIARQLNPTIGHRFMPYIVVVIDEYGDFIEEKGQDFETPIVQLAQYARAVGIHMIISTKRPTNDIITGAIKANFPTRIAFRLPERIDSQVILDCDGAEELLGNGDMLFRAGKSIDCIRVQCAFVDTTEVERINEFISCQEGYVSSYELPDPYYDGGESYANDVDMTHLDPLFEEAARLIIQSQEGSTSLIQRKFAIGYNRAERLMEQLEKAGVVGAAHGGKPREVFIMDEISLENLLSQL